MDDLKLKKYVKVAPSKSELQTTSITLAKRHVDFVRKANLNLSHLIRDVIDQIIKDEESKKGKGGNNE